jgi:chromosomal replication initiator protein
LSSALPATAQQLWEATLSQLLLRVTRQNFDSWLRNTVGLRYEETTLVVSAPNDLTCDWLSTRMRAVVAQALTNAAGPGMRVRFEPAEPVVKDDATQPLQPSMLPSNPTPLNPRFTFSNYLEANFNRLALTSARELVDGEDCHYSPLFIAGASGVGKTHLLHSIAHAGYARGINLLLVSAEQFLSEFTTAVRAKNGAAFRSRYRDLDMLLVDDVHFFLGKKGTLKEFYQTVAGLHDQGRRVAVAGDLSAMNGEAERFQSHLQWGLVANIEQPSVEDRVRFVDAKARAQGAVLPMEVQHYLALRVRSSLRDLEGAVNRVTALARILREEITIDFSAKAMQPMTVAAPESKPTVAPTELIDAVCRHLSLSPGEISSDKRARALTYARHVAMYLLREDASMTYTAIAHLLHKKDHSTVVHACSNLQSQLKVSPEVRADIDAIRALLHLPTTAA